MAKKFLSYGLTKGLSYREDWDRVLGRALQSETLDRQAQQAREEKVRYYTDKMKKGHAISERHQTELEDFYKDLNRQVADFPINHPGFETDLNLHMKFNQLTDQYLNNKYLVDDKKMALEWDKFRQAAPNLLEREIEENIKAYDDYNEGVTDTPYRFHAPKPFDYIPHVQNAVKIIGMKPEYFMVPGEDGTIYGTGSKWDIERIRDVARGLIIDNPEEYEREFLGVQQMGFDYTDVEAWITSEIESYLGPGGVKTGGRYSTYRTGTGTGTDSFYYNQMKKRTGSKNDPNMHLLIPTSTDTERNRWLDLGEEGRIVFLNVTEGFAEMETPFGVAKSTEPSKEPTEKRLPFPAKPNQFMIERVSPEWDTFQDGKRYGRARMKMLPETFEDLKLGEKLKSIGLPHELVEEKVKMTQADKVMQSMSMFIDSQTPEEEGTGVSLARTFAAGAEKPQEYWYFDAWIPLSNAPASITSYNLAHRNVPSKTGLEPRHPEFFYEEQSPDWQGDLLRDKETGELWRWNSSINDYEFVKE